MAKPSSRFLKGRKVKNVGATVIKRMIESINALENQEGRIKGGLKIKSAADFTSLKTLTSKFREECNQAHVNTLQDLVPEIEAALTNAMNTKAYNWAYGDGDIVQTGELRDSVDVVADAESIIVTYSAKNSDGTDYAAIVYWGGYAPYGNPSVRVYMPARPWIKHVLIGGYPGVQKFPLTERYLFHFEKNLRFLLPDVI